tara:strand:- start:367 stop:597 length:231 start_codon:yes stop_codon:yes gene_type:complete
MNPNKKEKMTPFEQAKINIRTFASNANMLFSTQMLAEAAITIKDLEGEEKDILSKMCDSTLVDLSSFIEEKGAKWN